MRKTITVGLVALLMLMIIPLTLTTAVDPEEAEPIFCTEGETTCQGFYTKECVDGNWWLPELVVGSCGVECLETSDCAAGLTCVGVRCVVDPTTPVEPVEEQQADTSRRNRNHWTDKTCNFDRKDVCRFRFKINQLVSFTHDGEDYTLDYVKYTQGAWYRNIWKFWRQSDPVISITAENGNSVYYGTPEEGEVLFDNLELTDFDFAGYFVWMTVEKVE